MTRVLRLIDGNEEERRDRKEAWGRHDISQDSPLTSMLKITLSVFSIRAAEAIAELFLYSLGINVHVALRYIFCFLKNICMTFKMYYAKWLADKLSLTKVGCRLWHQHIFLPPVCIFNAVGYEASWNVAARVTEVTASLMLIDCRLLAIIFALLTSRQQPPTLTQVFRRRCTVVCPVRG